MATPVPPALLDPQRHARVVDMALEHFMRMNATQPKAWSFRQRRPRM